MAIHRTAHLGMQAKQVARLFETAEVMNLFLAEVARRHPKEYIFMVYNGVPCHRPTALTLPETEHEGQDPAALLSRVKSHGAPMTSSILDRGRRCQQLP
jgi:hypothetical protein